MQFIGQQMWLLVPIQGLIKQFFSAIAPGWLNDSPGPLPRPLAPDACRAYK